MRHIFIFIFVGLLAALNSGCSTGSRLNSFVLENGQQLTFVRPSALSSSRCDVLIDFTYNSTPGVDVLCNFTIKSDEARFSTSKGLSFILNKGSDTLSVVNLKRLFVDESEARYTSTIAQKQFAILTRCVDTESCLHQILLQTANDSVKLETSSLFVKSMQAASRIFVN